MLAFLANISIHMHWSKVTVKEILFTTALAEGLLMLLMMFLERLNKKKTWVGMYFAAFLFPFATLFVLALTK